MPGYLDKNAENSLWLFVFVVSTCALLHASENAVDNAIRKSLLSFVVTKARSIY